MSGFGFFPGEGFFNAAANAAGSSGSILSPQVIRESARNFLANQSAGGPTVGRGSDLPIGVDDQKRMQEAIDIANIWIEDKTQFPVTVTNADVAWSRRDWIDQSVNGWQKIVEPLAVGMVDALAKVMKEMGPQFENELGGSENDSDDASPALGFGAIPGMPNIPGFSVDSFLPIMRTFMGQLIATQLGQSIGSLALGLTGSHDAAVPLFENSGAHLIPQNIAIWGNGLEIPEQEIAIYMALREVAAQRLFAHTPWLRDYVRGLIESFGRGITVDIEAITSQAESAMNSGELDITNPESISLAINQGMFQPEQSNAQRAALAKLEVTFALIEGWIDHVVSAAAQDRLPSLASLQESYRRSRVESAPTQRLFASLVGLQISPRLTREASHFWSEVNTIGGIEVRDHRWEDPALLPTATELGDPAAFLSSTTVPDDLSGLI